LTRIFGKTNANVLPGSYFVVLVATPWNNGTYQVGASVILTSTILTRLQAGVAIIGGETDGSMGAGQRDAIAPVGDIATIVFVVTHGFQTLGIVTSRKIRGFKTMIFGCGQLAYLQGQIDTRLIVFVGTTLGILLAHPIVATAIIIVIVSSAIGSLVRIDLKTRVGLDREIVGTLRIQKLVNRFLDAGAVPLFGATK
jgi:hypothetical protein